VTSARPVPDRLDPAGRPDPVRRRRSIDVRYGLDAQYLDDGEEYLVSAVVDPDLGVLVSRVTDPIEHFGGDEVIGVSESDVNCPDFEDPMRTLHLDGTAIEGGVLDPFFDARIRILGSILLVPRRLRASGPSSSWHRSGSAWRACTGHRQPAARR
jgi:hypothetical protein